MKKSTLNALMTGLIICLCLAIVVLIVKIQMRPKTVEQDNSEQVIVNEIVAPEPSAPVSESEEAPSEEVTVVKRVRIIKENINVRSGPGKDFEHLGAAYKGYNFEFVEQADDWVKIIYDGKEAYVFGELVEIIDMTMDENGDYTEYIPPQP